MTIELSEEERQLTLLALALTALLRPGFDYALGEVAKKLELGGDDLYTEFKRLNSDVVKPTLHAFRGDI